MNSSAAGGQDDSRMRSKYENIGASPNTPVEADVPPSAEEVQGKEGPISIVSSAGNDLPCSTMPEEELVNESHIPSGSMSTSMSVSVPASKTCSTASGHVFKKQNSEDAQEEDGHIQDDESSESENSYQSTDGFVLDGDTIVCESKNIPTADHSEEENLPVEGELNQMEKNELKYFRDLPISSSAVADIQVNETKSPAQKLKPGLQSDSDGATKDVSVSISGSNFEQVVDSEDGNQNATEDKMDTKCKDGKPITFTTREKNLEVLRVEEKSGKGTVEDEVEPSEFAIVGTDVDENENSSGSSDNYNDSAGQKEKMSNARIEENSSASSSPKVSGSSIEEIVVNTIESEGLRFSCSPSGYPRNAEQRDEESTYARSDGGQTFSVSGTETSEEGSSAIAVEVEIRTISLYLLKIGANIRKKSEKFAVWLLKVLRKVLRYLSNVMGRARSIAELLQTVARDLRTFLHRIACSSTKCLLNIFSFIIQIMGAVRYCIIPAVLKFGAKSYYWTRIGMNLLLHNPKMLECGPFSFAFAVDTEKLPSVYALHDLFGISRGDTSIDSGGILRFFTSSDNEGEGENGGLPPSITDGT